MKLSRKQQEINARKAADPIAQALGRDDIDYSDPDQLPTAPRQTAEQVLARLDKDLADGVAAMIETAGGVGRDLHRGVERKIPVEPQIDEPMAKGKVVGWKTELTVFERQATSEVLLSEGNAIADILIRTFSPEEREEVIWWVSRRVCFTCGIDTTDVQDHSHLIENGSTNL